VYREALERELAEEVRIETGFRERLVGLLNDDLTEVGRVHLGIVHLFEVEEPKVWAREESMLDAGFVPIEALLRELDGFETWSQLVLRHLFA
jgi:predicted NUDIX family phosphoesterase